MNTDKDVNPRLKIAGYEVIAVNCQDSATAHALAGQRLDEIEQRLAQIKKEKTALNRDKHCLTRWLRKNGANATVRGRQLGCDLLPFIGSRACIPRARNEVRGRIVLASSCAKTDEGETIIIVTDMGTSFEARVWPVIHARSGCLSLARVSDLTNRCSQPLPYTFTKFAHARIIAALI